MNLIALLKSHPFNYQEHQIFELCQDHHLSIYEKVKNIEIIQEIVNQAKALDLKSFFQWYLDKVYKVQNSETIRFLTYIFTYYQTINPFKISAGNFLIWLSDLMSNKQQKLYDNHSVRITTVHSAKGLEAPVVILADAYMSDNISAPRFAYEDDIFILNTKTASQKVKSLIYADEIQFKMENIRLLYVAMTRAKSELHVFGMDNSQDSWYSLIIQNKDLVI
jgi:ATP-dependent helicase/nuclease subunit A